MAVQRRTFNSVAAWFMRTRFSDRWRHSPMKSCEILRYQVQVSGPFVRALVFRPVTGDSQNLSIQMLAAEMRTS
jgi:hypothetical protein